MTYMRATLLLAGLAVSGCFGQRASDPLPAGAAISYRLERPGKVSVNIYDASGQVVREFLHTVPRTAGEHTELWDGCDAAGAPLAATNYTWKLVAVPGFTAEYLLSLGVNYPYGHYPLGAPGSHGGPFTAVMNSNLVYVAAAGHENIENYLVAVTPDNTRRAWSGMHRRVWEGGRALALDTNQLLVLSTLGEIYKYDAATGADTGGFVVPLAGLAEGGPEGMEKFMADRKAAADMDAAGGNLAVAYPAHNLVRLYRAQDGQKLAEWKVNAPRSVTLAPNGWTVYAASSSNLVRVTTNSPTPGRLVTGLGRPERLDYDAHDHTLLVYDGASSQVKRFSRAGKLLATFGRAGGRTDGLYAPQQNDFRGVTDLSADGAGGFIVAEADAAPRRAAHFDAKGSLVREWYGGQKWAPYVMVDPDDTGIVYMNSQWGTIMRLLVDYVRGTWTIHSTYTLTGLGDGSVGNDTQGDQWRLVKHDGKTFFFKQRNGACPLAVRLDEGDWRLRACTAYFRGPIWDGSPHQRSLKDALAIEVKKDPQHYARDNALWIDADGDGAMQPAEVQFDAGGSSGGAATEYVDAEGAILLAAQTQTGYQLVRRPVQRWTKFAPVYQMGGAGEQVLGPVPARFKNGQAWSAFPYFDPATSNAWCAFNSASEGWGGSADSFLVRWINGQPRWEVGRTQGNAKMYGAAAPDVFAPGSVGAFRVAAGSVNGCVTYSDYSGGAGQGPSASLYTWDADGLYVGGLLDNPDTKNDTVPLWMFGLGGETISVEVLKDPHTGDVLVFGNWENDQRVYRVRGWDGWQRAEGSFELKAPATGLRADYFADAAMTKPILTRLEAEPGQNRWPRGAVGGRWFGQFAAGVAGDYTFAVPPGAALMVNQQGAPRIPLQAGQRVFLQLESRQAGPGLTWSVSNQPPQSLASAKLAPSNPFTAAPFGVGTGLDTGRGRVLARETGWHRFSQNGMVNWVELWVDGQMISKMGKGVFRSRVWMEAGQFYDVWLTGPVQNLQWATPKGTWGGMLHDIPTGQLYPPIAERVGDRLRVAASAADCEAMQEVHEQKGTWSLYEPYPPTLSCGRVWDVHTAIMPFRLPVLAPGEDVAAATFRIQYQGGQSTVALQALVRISDSPQPELSDAQAGKLWQAKFATPATAANTWLTFAGPELTAWVQSHYEAGQAGRFVFLSLVPGTPPGPFSAAKFASGNSATPPILELTIKAVTKGTTP